MMSKRNLVFIMITTLVFFMLLGCGKTDTTADDNTENEQTESTTAQENNDYVVEEDAQEEVEENTDFVLQEGLITHLCDVANNPDATTNMDSGVTYMFSQNDDGSRKIGAVMAYYSGLSYEEATDNASFCKAFIDEYTPEIAEKWADAEIHEESNMYGVVISLDECDVTFMPDNDFEGMTVFVSTK